MLFLHPDTECYTEATGRDYRGRVAVTKTGKTCQKWTTQAPHKHTRTPEGYPLGGLGDHNYCRNPDSEPNGAWCYTENPAKRWEYCDIGEPSADCSNGGELTWILRRLHILLFAAHFYIWVKTIRSISDHSDPAAIYMPNLVP